MKKLLISLIEFYQSYLSFDKGILAVFAPGGACKNSLSCSEYAKKAIIKYGPVSGIKMSIGRIWSCR